MRPSLIPILVLTIVVGACAEPGEPGSSDPTRSAWELESGTLDDGPISIVVGHPITLSFTEDSAGGTAACNGYGGAYTISGLELTFAPPAVTEMACMPEEVMESEARYLAALVRVSNFSMAEEKLTLTGEGVELIFAELPPVPTAELTDTVWVLDSLVDDDAVSSVMGDRATLELFTDGSVIGSTGCRTFTGRYSISGADVVLTDLSLQGECPAELQDQDDQVVTVLGDGFRVETEGEILTVSPGKDQGLIYTAEG